jgi:adenylosuccinate lyase
VIERYTLAEMKAVWSEETKLKTWLAVELAIVDALAREGRIPKAAAATTRRRARYSVRRVSQIEDVIKHDMLAFVEAVGENLGTASRYFHMGVTSSDILDTALALVLRSATGLVLGELGEVRRSVAKLARRHRHTLVVGRTHGVHAEPTTLGLKFTVWYNGLGRAMDRIERAAEEVEVGKISGAVGNYSHLSPRTEDLALGSLGLKAERPATQVVQRDRHAAYVAALAVAASTLEQIALEVRHLQRTEVAEMEEPFERGQKGSSAMPHKRNPITLERICGLARLARTNALAAIENVALWHERDISHSSVERVILPDTTTLVHYMARNLKRVLDGLSIDAAKMAENLELTGGRIYSQRLMLALAEAGWGRRRAYEKVQQLAEAARGGRRHLRDVAIQDAGVVGILGKQTIIEVFDPSYYGRYTDQILKEAGVLPGAGVGRKNRRKRR